MPKASLNGLPIKGFPHCRLIPCQPVPVWTSSPDLGSPGAPLAEALDAIGNHLWPSMAETAWWSDAVPNRCIWAGGAAVDFLARHNIQAHIVSAVLEVFVLKASGAVSLPVNYIGTPEGEHGGVHNVVLIEEGTRTWLLETSLWQTHRPHHGDLPPMVVVDLLDGPCASPLPSFIVSDFDKTLDAQVNAPRPDGTIGLGWKLMPKRRNWRYASDASIVRAKAAVERMMQRMAA